MSSAHTLLLDRSLAVPAVSLWVGAFVEARNPPHGNLVGETKQLGMALDAAAEVWRAEHAKGCPTPQFLEEQHEINATRKITDAWETPFKIVCDDDSVTVVSFGPDRKEGTADDIRIPEPANKNSQ